MRDYIIGLVVAGVVLTSGYVTLEMIAGRAVFSQDVAPTIPNDQLLAVLTKEGATEEERVAAILQLGDAKTDLDVIVPVLVKWLGNKAIYRQSCSMALEKIGDAAVEHIKPYFASEFETNAYGQISNVKEVLGDRAAGCSASRALGDRCKIFLPKIQAMLKADDKKLRFCALYALEGMKESAKESLDLVITCLDDEDFNNQCYACRIVKMLGPDAAKAEPKLQFLLVKGLPSVRGWAAICLGAIGPSPSNSDNASALAKNLKTASPVELTRILDGLAGMGPRAKHVTKDIRELLNNWDRDVQAHAAIALWKIDDDLQLAIDTIGNLLTSEGYEQDGLDMAATMGKDAFPLIAKIKSLVKSDDAYTRERVAIAIAEIGPQAKTAAPALKTLLNDEDPIVRYQAIQALKAINEK